MSVIETLLIFGGIPLAVYLVVAALVYTSGGRQVPRYRPGRPFVFAPVWYVAARPEDHAAESDAGLTPALPAAAARPALPSGQPVGRAAATTLERGGARGTW